MRSYPNQRELMARTGPGRFSAGDGLYLQVTSSGTRSWVFRYRVGDKQHWMGLGSARYLTLALAKQKAIDAQRLRLNGVWTHWSTSMRPGADRPPPPRP
jgi:hypothetical protein